MARLLFLWSKSNPDIGYFQGLNDVAVPFFIVYLSSFFSNNLDDITLKLDKIEPKKLVNIEADVFWSLYALTDQLKVKFFFLFFIFFNFLKKLETPYF